MSKIVLILAAAGTIGVLALGAGGASAQTSPTLMTLHSFTGTDGNSPAGGPISDASGALYGTTENGGAYNRGTVYKLARPSSAGAAWTESVLYSFTGSSDGGIPVAGLISDISGNLYGTTSQGGSAAVCTAAYNAGVSSCNQQCNFDARCVAACLTPYFYQEQACIATNEGGGVVFMLSPPTGMGGQWTETVLHTFIGTDGATPNGGLIADASGNLYGTTVTVGTNNYGTVFKLTPPNISGGSWTLTTLYNFNGGTSDGSGPASSLLLDSSGALYGTTAAGGPGNSGTVFKVTPQSGGSWVETVLYSFMGGSDGASPQGGLISDASGALYGTTAFGGLNGYGTLFQLTPPLVAGASWNKNVLYSFTGAGDGSYPASSVLFDASGALYGTTSGGSTTTDYGTVFKLAPPTATGGTWTETILHNFKGGSDGAYPIGNLIADASGSLYGTTTGGDTAADNGTMFQLTVPAAFSGLPGKANCSGQSISFLAKKYGGIAHAAASLGYASVTALQNAIVAYCGG
jgi:uncharacterized repeat protein (TIGR03803 family)